MAVVQSGGDSSYIDWLRIHLAGLVLNMEYIDLGIEPYTKLSDEMVTLIRWVKTDIQNCAPMELYKLGDSAHPSAHRESGLLVVNSRQGRSLNQDIQLSARSAQFATRVRWHDSA